MLLFLGGTLGFSVLIYVVLVLSGDMGVVFGEILCAGALFAALFCLTQITLRSDPTEQKQRPALREECAL